MLSFYFAGCGIGNLSRSVLTENYEYDTMERFHAVNTVLIRPIDYAVCQRMGFLYIFVELRGT